MEHGHLRDDRLGALCFAIEDDQRRLALFRGLRDLAGRTHCAVELCQVDGGDEGGGAFGGALHIRSERLDVISPRDDEHAVAHLVVAPYVLARHAQHRVRGNEDDHSSEDHEPGQDPRADHKLDQRDRDRGCRNGEGCGHPRAENGPRHVGDPDSVCGQSEGDHVDGVPRSAPAAQELVVTDEVRVELAEADDDPECDRVYQPTHGPLHSTLNHPGPRKTRLSVCFCVLLLLRCDGPLRPPNTIGPADSGRCDARRACTFRRTSYVWGVAEDPPATR